MEPLFAIGAWALSLVGIAALVLAARKAGAVHDLGHDDDRAFSPH
jgi:hypothetical protein